MRLSISQACVAAASLTLSTAALVQAAAPEAPTGLKVNDINAPVGTADSVYFGWLVNDPDPDEIQTRKQILIASSEANLSQDKGDVWDSGEVETSRQNHVPFGGTSLKSDQRYYWKVRTWDKDGNASPWSAASTFTVGLRENADWQGASWIRRDNKDKDDYTCYRKKAALPDKPIERATVYISGTHKYEFHLNGQRIGKGPAFHHPEYQYYNAFDITSSVKAGQDNQFAVFNHWFGGGQGRPASARGIILKAIIRHTDGTETVVNSDGTWLQSRAEAWVLNQPDRNRGEGVGYVECIDARKLLPDWTSITFNDSSWKPVSVVGPHPTKPWTGTLSPDLTRIQEYPIAPVSITSKGNGKYVIDLGKVYAGIPRIVFSGGNSGTTVTMRGSYTLNSSGEIPPGTQSQSTLMEYKAILDGQTFTYEPVEYLGFRYFQIDNAPMPVTEDNFSFIVRHTELNPAASSFSSSNTTLNEVWEFMKHSVITCAMEEFVDTPTREKGGFLGDSFLQSTAAMLTFAERPLTQRTLNEFLQSMDQHWSSPENRGRMNAVYPNNDRGRDIPDFTLSYLAWTWNYYMETGDRDFLIRNYDKLKSIGEYINRHIDPDTGLVTRLTGGSNAYLHGIIDWPATMRYDYDMKTDPRTVLNGWAYAGLQTLAKISAETGNNADQELYLKRADALRTAFNDKLLSPAGVYVDGLLGGGKPSAKTSQHANMFPLALGIVPEDKRDSVIELVKQQRMRVGMITVRWLVLALGEARQGPHLIDLFTNKEWDGWANNLSKGATSTWESWDADTTGQSMSHAWGAIGVEGYIRYILGIRPTKPQYEEVLIQPLDFANKLDWAKGTITTERGPISVHWKRNGDSLAMQVEIPVNVTAKIALPKGKTSSTALTLNGKPAIATEEGDYLILTGIGSGKHTIIR
ncbi:MAG: family 78 glycoside hydrolase catalytic domain [Luteolibacter sp.]